MVSKDDYRYYTAERVKSRLFALTDQSSFLPVRPLLCRLIMRHMRQLSIIIVVLGALLSQTAEVSACSVPVFRYALDHWFPDAYRISIFHEGALSEDEQAVIADLEHRAEQANFTISVTDLAGEVPPKAAELWQRHKSENLPTCIVEMPSALARFVRHVDQIPLDSAQLNSYVTSPLRQELVRKLVSGTSVVWVYLESGIADKDDSAFELLEQELARLEQTLKLPEIAPEDLSELSGDPDDLKIRFEAVRLSRSEPAEAALVDMLLTVEPDLKETTFIGEPMTFPIFGRGRALYSLVGAGINPETIEDACRFLTGACQCTVKQENPGVDLLMSVDWDELVHPMSPEGVEVTLTGLAGFEADDQSHTNETEATAVAVADAPVAGGAEASPASVSQSPGDEEVPEPTAAASSASSSRVRPQTSLTWAAWAVLGLLGSVVILASLGSFFRG